MLSLVCTSIRRELSTGILQSLKGSISQGPRRKPEENEFQTTVASNIGLDCTSICRGTSNRLARCARNAAQYNPRALSGILPFPRQKIVHRMCIDWQASPRPTEARMKTISPVRHLVQKRRELTERIPRSSDDPHTNTRESTFETSSMQTSLFGPRGPRKRGRDL